MVEAGLLPLGRAAATAVSGRTEAVAGSAVQGSEQAGSQGRKAKVAAGRERGAKVAGGRARGAKVAADGLAVGRVAVDVSLPHLDRPFDYLVPERLSPDAVPGCRVRVRFAGRLVGGYLLQRAEASQHEGGLAFLERVVSPEPVLTGEIAGLARAVADRYGGTLADVLRLAIPPRHAAVESAPPLDVPRPRPAIPEPGPWARYPAGRSFLTALARGRAPRAAWSALPGPHWPDEIARAASTAPAAGSGALIARPDARSRALGGPPLA